MLSLKQVNQDRVQDFLRERWGGEEMVLSAGTFRYDELDGFVYEENDQLTGIVTYARVDHELMIVSLNSEVPGKGIGERLLKRVEQEAIQDGFAAITVLTTNDNVRSLAFYQKNGFRLTEVIIGAADEARKQKPSIPFTGESGIAVRDEWKLVKRAAGVQLQPFDETFRDALSRFELSDEQHVFTSLPLRKIAMAPDAHHVVVVKGGEAAGYFCLEQGEKKDRYTANSSAVLLTSFSVTTAFQGKGVAANAITKLKDYIRLHFPQVNEVVLGVNERNRAAQSLYLRYGFTDQGERYEGPKGKQLVLSMAIEREETYV